ncbi:hypothetical protein B551_0221870 [Cupriavidus sp. HPC(L)]|nr:hypothetical protein B551_0221870 [Cupriavidus sp. HPC(L)]
MHPVISRVVDPLLLIALVHRSLSSVSTASDGEMALIVLTLRSYSTTIYPTPSLIVEMLCKTDMG